MSSALHSLNDPFVGREQPYASLLLVLPWVTMSGTTRSPLALLPTHSPESSSELVFAAVLTVFHHWEYEKGWGAIASLSL